MPACYSQEQTKTNLSGTCFSLDIYHSCGGWGLDDNLGKDQLGLNVIWMLNKMLVD